MPGLFSPPSINLCGCWPLLLCLGHVWLPLSKDSFVLALAVVRGWSNSEPDCQTLSLVHPRPHKSYIGVVYLCVSRSTLLYILNLIFKVRFTQFKGRFNLGGQNLPQKNAGARSQPFGNFFSLFGVRRESFPMMLPQETCPQIFSLLR